MNASSRNLVLIGMPGSGKSTIGVILAKKTSRAFIDTDVTIQTYARRPLQEVVDEDGYMALREMEEKVILQLHVENHVIATGGSAVYSPRSMSHLGKNAVIIFLDAGPETLRKRITDYDSRGIAKRPGQSFEELFAERSVLYRRYAHLTIKNEHSSQEEACQAIMASLAAYRA